MSSLSPDRRDKIEASRQRELSRAYRAREKKVDKMVQNILAEKKYKLTAALSAAYNAQASRSPSRPARKARECGLSRGAPSRRSGARLVRPSTNGSSSRRDLDAELSELSERADHVAAGIAKIKSMLRKKRG